MRGEHLTAGKIKGNNISLFRHAITDPAVLVLPYHKQGAECIGKLGCRGLFKRRGNPKRNCFEGNEDKDRDNDNNDPGSTDRDQAGGKFV